MSFLLPFETEKGRLLTRHGDGFFVIGSCFSDAMFAFLAEIGHTVLANPFGTVYHPLALANSLTAAFEHSEEVVILQRDDLFFAWECSGAIWAFSETELRAKVLEIRKEVREFVKNASVLVATFGTAWGYMLQGGTEILGNCHKMPGQQFSKELSSTEDIVSVWKLLMEKIKVLNPDLQFVFTVSPVRHKRDGLVENNRSKARLIEAVHSLLSPDKAYYFPAYELLIDHLRDYRFYASDFIHPSKEAEQLIWRRFEAFVFSDAALHLNEEVRSLRLEAKHESLYPESRAENLRKQALEQKIKTLLEANVLLKW